ncbi:MAG: DUF86 domain-containing protein [Sphingobacteriaceae bacterium]
MRNSILNDKIRLLHILEAITEIESYLTDIDHNAFSDSSVIRNATLMQIQIIGEATSNISDRQKEEFPDIEWKQIKSTRNIIAHEYFGIDYDIIWDIATFKLPIFKEQVRLILKNVFEEPH